MKKGNMSIHALMSLVIVVAIIALVIYLIYSWTTQGSDAFTELLRMGG